MKSYIYTETPMGIVTIAEENGAITNLYFGEVALADSVENETSLLNDAKRQLAEYFNRERREFSLPINPLGTVFQRCVWEALCDIPYGETTTYKAIANKIHHPCAARAVGMANNKNPVPIIIPCHRVIGANGILKGYGGGIDKMEFLLKLENKNISLKINHLKMLTNPADFDII